MPDLPESNSAATSVDTTNDEPILGRIGHWFDDKDATAHNEAIYAWEREAQSAREARDYETWLANTQMQRKVEDYRKAGFSPLAALEASGGSYTPTISSATSSAAHRGESESSKILSTMIMALVMLASRGMASSATAAKAASKFPKGLGLV